MKKSWSALLVFLGLNFLFAWGNILTQKGSILDGAAILNPEDPIRQTTSYVESKEGNGFEGREMIPFIIPFPGGIQTTADLQSIWRLTAAVKGRFGNRVVSLAEIPAY
ncbi:MAG: hypothetical protein ACRERD_24985, partial [Candidatus Binatia bacterium]